MICAFCASGRHAGEARGYGTEWAAGSHRRVNAPVTLTVSPMVFKSNGSSNGTNGTWGSNFASLSVASLGYWMDKQVRSGFAYKEQYTGGVNNGSGDP